MSDLDEGRLGTLLKADLGQWSWTTEPWPSIRTRLFVRGPKRSPLSGRRLLASAGAALVAAVAVGAVLPQTRDTARALIEKGLGTNPWEHLTDAQKQTMVDRVHERNAAFLRDFVRRYGDPRTLPVIKVHSEGQGPATLQEAISQAPTIVRGMVTDTSFVSNPSGGMPLATASVATVEVIKGNAPVALQVRQQGGPVAQYAGGALTEFDTDPLLLPGDDVILLLVPGRDGYLHTIPQDGILYVVGDVVRAEDGSPISVQVSGLPVADVLRLLRSRQ